jgi:RimJ/RimL family protein N-acetyltransferase
VKSAGVFLFYRLEKAPQSLLSQRRDCGFQAEFWYPSIRRPWPRRVSRDQRPHFLFRTLLHVLARFPARNSGALTIYDGPRLAHYSAFTPRYWRFPFLSATDLQIGDTWTDPFYRGKGLAKVALSRLIAELQRPGRCLWYVVEDINVASVKVAEDCGFGVGGLGTRIKWLPGLDYYEIKEAAQSSSIPVLRAKNRGSN